MHAMNVYLAVRLAVAHEGLSTREAAAPRSGRDARKDSENSARNVR